MEENRLKVTYDKYDNLYYATKYVKILGKITQYGETKEIAIKNLYKFISEVADEGCSRWILPKKEGIGICMDGFPVTTGCWPGRIGKRLAAKVHCVDEEWCGKMYFFNGGKPCRSKEGNNE